MKNFLLASSIFCALSVPAIADVQQHVDYIVSETVTKELFEGAILAQRPVIISAMENELRKKGIQTEDLNAFFDVFIEEFIGEFTDSMRSQTGEIYHSLFSDDELAGIAQFYKTPAGQAMIENTPALMQGGAALGQRAGYEAGVKVKDRVKKRLEEEDIEFSSPNLAQRILDAL